LCSVVKPNELFSAAYSRLPMRINVLSSSRTTAASTLSRGRPRRRKSRRTLARTRGSAAANAAKRSNFPQSRIAFQRG
jgi:hypothetical protein